MHGPHASLERSKPSRGAPHFPPEISGFPVWTRPALGASCKERFHRAPLGCRPVSPGGGWQEAGRRPGPLGPHLPPDEGAGWNREPLSRSKSRAVTVLPWPSSVSIKRTNFSNSLGVFLNKDKKDGDACEPTWITLNYCAAAVAIKHPASAQC